MNLRMQCSKCRRYLCSRDVDPGAIGNQANGPHCPGCGAQLLGGEEALRKIARKESDALRAAKREKAHVVVTED